MPQILAMALIQRDLGPRSPWGRFRIAVQRFDEVLLERSSRRRAGAAGRRSVLSSCSSSATSTATRPLTATSATSSSRCWWAATTARRLRSPGRSNVSPVTPRPRAPARGRPGVPRRGRQGGAARAARADDRSAAAARAGPDRRPRAPAGVQVAACLWLAMRREDLWPQASAFAPERWLEGPQPNPLSWIPYGGGVRRCAGSPFAEMEMREVLRAAAAAAAPARSGRSPSARGAACSWSCPTAAAS